MKIETYNEDKTQVLTDVDETKGKITLDIKDGKFIKVFKPYSQEVINNMRINELRNLLANTDYKAIKYAEGQFSEEEYAPIKAQRQAWREEINQLEEQINNSSN